MASIRTCVLKDDLITPVSLLPLDNDPEMGPQLHQLGLRAPDAVMFGANAAGEILLIPIDYKFSLDHAEGGQVVSAIIVGAGEAVGEKFSAAVCPRLGLPIDGRWQDRVVDGALVTPSSESNHLYIVPGDPAMIWFSVTVSEFFDELPATEIARWLAKLDRVSIANDDFDLMSAYFRLGAGVAGGISRLDKPLFSHHERGEVDMASVDRLQEIVAGLRRPSTADLVDYVRPLMAERRDLRSRLATMLKRPVGRGQLNRVAGFPAETPIENWPAEYRKALGQVTSDDRDLALHEARQLSESGVGDHAVFDALGANHRARAKRFEALFKEAISHTPE